MVKRTKTNKVGQARKGWWRQRDGQLIRIRKMSDIHLLHTIRMFERIAAVIQLDMITTGYGVLCSLHGEMARFYCEQEIAQMEQEEPIECLEFQTRLKYEELEEERERRGLTRLNPNIVAEGSWRGIKAR